MNKGTQRLVNFLVACALWGGLLYMVATRKIKSPTDMWEKVETVLGVEVKKPPPPPPPKPKVEPPPPPPPVAREILTPVPAAVETVSVPTAPPVAPPPPCQASGPSIKKGFNTDRAYPDLAVRRGIEGKVTVRYTVGPDGNVATVEVVSADPPGYFERAVEIEFKKMRWNPAKDGSCNPTTSGSQTQNVVFRLG